MCGEVLYDYSVHASHFYQGLGFPPTKHRREASNTLFTIYFCPFVCGWYVVLFFKSVPCNLNNSVQKWLMKILYRPDTIVPGNPCSHTTSFTNAEAIIRAVKGWRTGMKWALLSEAINNHKKCINSVGIRQTLNEIHWDIWPDHSGDMKRLKQPSWRLLRHLILLTNTAFVVHIMTHISSFPTKT